jgi:hypothetical protein
MVYDLSPTLELKMRRLGRFVAMTADDVLARPDDMAEWASRQPFRPAARMYPGSQSMVVTETDEVAVFRAKILDIVNSHYLTRLNISRGGRPVRRLDRMNIDFARVDRLPEELLPGQTVPHVDPVPIFGLIYLSRADRGGTLFFEEEAGAGDATANHGRYADESTPGWTLCGRIEGRFNRLAIYPGFLPHSAEISGDWIRTGERLSSPRLTMRLIFFEESSAAL